MLRRNLYRAGAGLLALAVALLVARATLGRLAALTDPIPVVVARTAIPPYAAISADMVEVVYLPRGGVAQPVYADPGEVVGLLARLELLPGVPLLRAYVVPAAELRYTTDAQAVVLGVAVDEAHVPGDLLLAGQRVDVWQADRLVGPGLRVVAIVSQHEWQTGGGPGEQPGVGPGAAGGLGPGRHRADPGAAGTVAYADP